MEGIEHPMITEINKYGYPLEYYREYEKEEELEVDGE